MRNREATAITSDLAAQQWGLVTAAQARDAGVAAFMLGRLVEQGVLLRVRHGVYATSSTPFSSVLEVRAQWLALDPSVMAADRRNEGARGVVVSHETAAELHGIGDLPTGMITFTTARRRQTKQPDVRFHTASLAAAEISTIEGLPVTTVSRTVWDLARAGHEPGHLTDMIRDALTGNLVTKDELADTLQEVAELFGAAGTTAAAMRARLDELVPEADPGDDVVTRAVREAVAPLQQQLQELLSYLSPQSALPGEVVRRQLPTVPTVNRDAVVPSAVSTALDEQARDAVGVSPRNAIEPNPTVGLGSGLFSADVP